MVFQTHIFTYNSKPFTLFSRINYFHVYIMFFHLRKGKLNKGVMDRTQKETFLSIQTANRQFFFCKKIKVL